MLKPGVAEVFALVLLLLWAYGVMRYLAAKGWRLGYQLLVAVPCGLLAAFGLWGVIQDPQAWWLGSGFLGISAGGAVLVEKSVHWLRLACFIPGTRNPRSSQGAGDISDALTLAPSQGSSFSGFPGDKHFPQPSDPGFDSSFPDTSGLYVAVIEFDYVDSKGRTSHRKVYVDAVAGDYIQGFCRAAKATRTFTVSRIQGQVLDQGTGRQLSPRLWMEEAKKSPLNMPDLVRERIARAAARRLRRQGVAG